MILEDLTKEELIALIRRCWIHGPREQDIWRVRLDSIADRSRVMLEEAVRQMNRGIDQIGTDGFLQAQKLFDEGMALFFQHNLMLREFEQMFYSKALAFLSEEEHGRE